MWMFVLTWNRKIGLFIFGFDDKVSYDLFLGYGNLKCESDIMIRFYYSKPVDPFLMKLVDC